MLDRTCDIKLIFKRIYLEFFQTSGVKWPLWLELHTVYFNVYVKMFYDSYSTLIWFSVNIVMSYFNFRVIISERFSLKQISCTVQKIKFFPLNISSVNLTKSLMENFIFCAVLVKNQFRYKYFVAKFAEKFFLLISIKIY